ncbi:AAA family ATPase [[Mycobacterium] crassicus]|uniref:Adenylate/guanylate cyclase domain-containing protein n=1 Tax=[Mycobacterium] crassicus TaxID=2872309 RepID=A0ABU5XFZ2_9MYCO|nr:adenylate/guanylate cyclase domain-containing protein [Mycolicibacter sp. MYC098]MEB3021200.1 adenylate/guanylate cyclase domain-containing protein [Mycolicibacter sp. MYC098]
MTACVACATELQANAKFCFECGASVAAAAPAEFKQVTVLFADVVHSMDIAAAVGPERLREIMGALFDLCAAVVQRFGGRVEKFIGDAVMAVFGAPVSLEDHAFRACLAALEIQRVNAATGDGGLQLRVGLNSGQVVAGEIGSGPGSYTAIGEQVGLAQRMESVAPVGGVLLSDSTARLVGGWVVLADPEWVRIKGVAEPVRVHRLLGASPESRHTARQDPSLVGRGWEMGALTGILERAISGTGCVIGVVGPPGIGKSRIAREVSGVAQGRGVAVFAAYCESHAVEVPFHAVTSLLATALSISGLGDEAARARIRDRAPDADPQDLLLLDDLLGIRGDSVELAAIDPDARRRRLTRLVNNLSLARQEPVVYVIEDVHWIDEVSELLLADFLAVIPQTASLVVITYRPEYHGVLTRIPNSQTITLAPLNASQSATLATELLGSHPSVSTLCQRVVERAAGNPFFAEEIVRDLADRGVLSGSRGGYVCEIDDADVAVPATLQAAIASRIDRLEPAAKQTLNAAAVIGLRFDAEQLAVLDGGAQVDGLIAAELVEQVRFTPHPEYTFRHPLVRIVAYESQLRAQRANLHRRFATAIEQRHADAIDENAALIAEHLESAGDLPAAYSWRMRAGAWAQHRDIRAARVSWDRARAIADQLPTDHPGRESQRIAPRTLLCASTSWVGGSVADAGFDELHELCTDVDDKLSLAVGMAGLMTALIFHSRYVEASRIASDCSRLLELIGDPTMTVALAIAPCNIKLQAGEAAESLRLAQLVIDLADGDPAKGNLVIGSPLAIAIMFRGSSRYCLGLPGWKEDLDQALVMARGVDSRTFVTVVLGKYGLALYARVVLSDAAADRDTAQALEMAEQAGDDYAVDTARLARGIVLLNQGGSQREAGFALLTQYRDAYLRHGYAQRAVRFFEAELAREKARIGEIDEAVELARTAVDYLFETGDMMARGETTRILVEALLQRGNDIDRTEARGAIDRLAAVPTDAGYALFDIPLLRMRALLALANGDELGYRDFADRYRTKANELGYEGHIALAEAMR